MDETLVHLIADALPDLLSEQEADRAARKVISVLKAHNQHIIHIPPGHGYMLAKLDTGL